MPLLFNTSIDGSTLSLLDPARPGCVVFEESMGKYWQLTVEANQDDRWPDKAGAYCLGAIDYSARHSIDFGSPAFGEIRDMTVAGLQFPCLSTGSFKSSMRLFDDHGTRIFDGSLKQGKALIMQYCRGRLGFKLEEHLALTDVTKDYRSLAEKIPKRIVPCIWVYAQQGDHQNYGVSTVEVNLKGLTSKRPPTMTLSNEMPFTDCAIVCGSEQIRAHRVVLCAASPVFDAAFTGSLREASEASYVIEGCNQVRIAKFLIDFMYTGVLPEIDVSDLTTLLPLADFFQRDDLWSTIVGKLIDNATEETFPDIAQVLMPLSDHPTKSWAYSELLGLLKTDDRMLDSLVRAESTLKRKRLS